MPAPFPRSAAGAAGQISNRSSRERYQVARPNDSNQERLVAEALEATATPGAILAEYQPKQRELFPPRFGFEAEQPTIDDVINTEFPNPRFPNKGNRDTHANLVQESIRKRAQNDQRIAFSGGPAGFSATSRPSNLGWF